MMSQNSLILITPDQERLRLYFLIIMLLKPDSTYVRRQTCSGFGSTVNPKTDLLVNLNQLVAPDHPTN